MNIQDDFVFKNLVFELLKFHYRNVHINLFGY